MQIDNVGVVNVDAWSEPDAVLTGESVAYLDSLSQRTIRRTIQALWGYLLELAEDIEASGTVRDSPSEPYLEASINSHDAAGRLVTA